MLLAGFALGGAPGLRRRRGRARWPRTSSSGRARGRRGRWPPGALVGVLGAALGARRPAAARPRRRSPLACGAAGLRLRRDPRLLDLGDVLRRRTRSAQYLRDRGASLPFNIAHAVGNVVFCLAFGPALRARAAALPRALRGHAGSPRAAGGRGRRASLARAALAVAPRAGPRRRPRATRGRRLPRAARRTPTAASARRRGAGARPRSTPAGRSIGLAAAGRDPGARDARRCLRRRAGPRTRPRHRRHRAHDPRAARRGRDAAPRAAAATSSPAARASAATARSTASSTSPRSAILALRAAGAAGAAPTVRAPRRCARAPAEPRRRLQLRAAAAAPSGDRRHRAPRSRRSSRPGRARRARGAPRGGASSRARQNPDGGFPLSAGRRARTPSRPRSRSRRSSPPGASPSRVRRGGARSPLAYLRSLAGRRRQRPLLAARARQTPVWVTAQALAGARRAAPLPVRAAARADARGRRRGSARSARRAASRACIG